LPLYKHIPFTLLCQATSLSSFQLYDCEWQ
jgi:hypothetical protein